jgi:Ca2+-binding RTX toxin-like protein
MAGTVPSISIASVPGGQIGVSEAGLPNGTQAGQARTSGSWTFTISAPDGVDDLTVGSYRAITDGVFTAGSATLGPGVLSVTAYNPADGTVTVSYEMTSPYESPYAGPQQRYGDFLSAPIVLSDRDGDQAQASLGIQIRDDETLTLSQDSATVQAGRAVTGNVVTDGTPDRFTADGFGSVTRAGTDTATPVQMPERGIATVEGAYGTLTLDRWGAYTYTARADAPAGSVDHLRYWASDGDGDEASSWLHITIQGAPASPATPTLGFTTRDLTAAEGQIGNGNTLQFRVELSQASTSTVTANWAVAGSGANPASDGDFNSGFPSGTLTFAAGETVKVFSVTMFGDAVVEPDEQFTVTLSNLSGADAGALTAIGRIANDDGPEPSPAGNVITARSPNSTLTGGAGNDTITGSQGGDTITTGGGADVLILPGVPWSPHIVKDFTLGADKLDFRGMSSFYGGSDPVRDGYITFLDDGAGGTKVLWDRDAAGPQQQWPSYILHLQGVSSQGLTWNALANPGGSPPPPDSQPTISANPDGSGALVVTVSDANIANGTSPDAAALTRSGFIYLRAADGVDDFTVNQTTVVRDGVFTAATLTTTYGNELRFTSYDASTGALAYSYVHKYAKEHPAPNPGQEMSTLVEGFNLVLTDRDGDRANVGFQARIEDDKSITHDDTDTVTAGTTTVATGNVMTDASEGDSGDGDTGRDIRGADQANPYGIASVNTGSANVGYSSNGQWQVNGQYGTLKFGIVGDYTYTPFSGVSVGAVDTFTYYLKDNDGTPPVTGKLTITFTGGGDGGGTGGGQTIVSPGPNSTLTGGAGADTITAGQGGDTITGGAGADWFVFNKNPWSPHTIKDFRVGEDKLDLSAVLQAARYTGTDPVADKYVWLQDNGSGGLNVLFDWDGTGPNPQWPNFLVRLEGVSASTTTWAQLTGGGTGGTTEPPPPPPPPGDGQVITSTGPGATLSGGAGNDTLNASRGEDVLTGEGGADRFVFADENWAPATITDFDAAEGDRIDLSGVFDDWGYAGADPFADGRLILQGDGQGSTLVLLDDDGPGGDWPNYVLLIRGVGLEVMENKANWIFQ